MKTVGIIAEYNPFHNGHAYQIKKAKERTGADYAIIVMSGDFVQRGEPAIVSKHLRAKMALDAGADLVLMMPACYSTASAESFARSGVLTLAATGMCDCISFGMEEDDFSSILPELSILVEEPAQFKELLSDNLRNGQSYAAARTDAFLQCVPIEKRDCLEAFLSRSNNLLAIEYMRALHHYGLEEKIVCAPVKRVGSDYQDTTLSGSMASASACRKLLENIRSAAYAWMDSKDASHSGLFNSEVLQLADIMPSQTLEDLAHYSSMYAPVFPNDCSSMLYLRLQQLFGEGATTLPDIYDCSKDLALRIKNCLPEYQSFTSFCELVNNKSLSTGRVARVLMHALLDTPGDAATALLTQGISPYLRVLGFRRESSELLSAIKANASAPLLTKVADAKAFLEASYEADATSASNAKVLLAHDIYAASIYRGLVGCKCGNWLKNEYQQQLVIM